MPDLKSNEEMARIAEEVISEVEELNYLAEEDVSIGFYTSEKVKRSKGRGVYGECVKPPKRYDAFIPFDYLIIFYKPFTKDMTREQLKILMEHELLHIGIKNGKKGIRGHDFEDFKQIVDKYGSKWAE